MKSPKVMVIAGPNGAGKSTVASVLVPSGMTYVNADDIAKTLPSYPSQEADIEAGRLVLRRLDELESRREDFAVETTLAGRSLAFRIERLRRSGYVFRLIFLWTPSAEFSIERVAARVRAGGHNIPEDVIRRRHTAGIANFFQLYRPIADTWAVYQSTRSTPEIVAEGRMEIVDQVEDHAIWDLISGGFGDGR